MTTQTTAPATKIVVTPTNHTCGEACWNAVEETCHCSCGGRNHGILRGMAERPKRTCKIGGLWYELFEVGTRAVCSKRLDELAPGEFLYIGARPGTKYYCACAKQNQKIWPEIYGLNILQPFIIWKRIESPLAAMQA